jgi:hypothetical protein
LAPYSNSIVFPEIIELFVDLTGVLLCVLTPKGKIPLGQAIALAVVFF